MLKKFVLGLALVFASAELASAQLLANAIKRTPVQDVDFPSGYHVVEVIAEIPAGTESAGRHTHPGVDASYVLEGEGTLMVEGKPDQTLKPGVAIQAQGQSWQATQIAGDLYRRKGQAGRHPGAEIRRQKRRKHLTSRRFLLKNTLLAGRLRPALRFATRGLLRQAYGADLSVSGMT